MTLEVFNMNLYVYKPGGINNYIDVRQTEKASYLKVVHNPFYFFKHFLIKGFTIVNTRNMFSKISL